MDRRQKDEEETMRRIEEGQTRRGDKVRRREWRTKRTEEHRRGKYVPKVKRSQGKERMGEQEEEGGKEITKTGDKRK